MKIEFLTIPKNGGVANLPDSIFLYGVGTFAVEIVATLKRLGINILGYIDHVPAPSNAWDGYKYAPYFHINEVRFTKSSTVVIGVHNLHGNLQKIRDRILQIDNQVRILSPVELINALSGAGVRIENYWLTSDQSIYDTHAASIKAFKQLLKDQKSRILLDHILEYRKNGQINALPETELLEHQYVPMDLLTPPRILRMVELGAFTGDNLREFVRQGISFEFALSLEPDKRNFASLVSTILDLNLSNVFALPLAGWNKTEMLMFSDTGDAGAVMTQTGNTFITATTVDELVGNSKVNYIKMDIEGAELLALQGAKNTILNYTPHLAISVYHRPEDLWKIGLKIEEISIRKYDYFLRQYGQQLFDTILYAIPTEQR